MNKTIFVDVDDTMVRSFGTKRIPIPDTISSVKQLASDGFILFCWSSGGAEYAENSAKELGIHHLFKGFLGKPDYLIDDQKVSEWRTTQEIHPSEIREKLLKPTSKATLSP